MSVPEHNTYEKSCKPIVLQHQLRMVLESVRAIPGRPSWNIIVT